MRKIKAIVIDNDHLKLTHPISLPSGKEIELILLETETLSESGWLNLSLSGLSKAYSDQEPVYNISMVKEKNPDYKS